MAQTFTAAASVNALCHPAIIRAPPAFSSKYPVKETWEHAVAQYNHVNANANANANANGQVEGNSGWCDRPPVRVTAPKSGGYLPQ